MTSSPSWITVAPSAPAEGSSDGAPPGFPGRAPGSRTSHLGNFQTALLGRITPATTRGYQSVSLFSALRPPATGEDFTLVLPRVNADLMDLFLARFAASLPPDIHAVLVLDGAGWHDPRALRIPDNLTLVPLPSYSPELNPVERVWLYLRERFLSLRVLADTEAIIEACCHAWNALVAEPDRLRSLCAYPWITKVNS